MQSFWHKSTHTRKMQVIQLRHQGFTLLELMIVVAVIGVLAAIAYPSYQDYIRKGKRAEGRAALMEFMQQQEKYMTQRNTYKALTEGETGTSFKTWSGDGGTSKASYLLKAEACGAGAGQTISTCVVLTAVQKFNDTDAGNLTYTSLGVKDCTGSKKDLCWR